MRNEVQKFRINVVLSGITVDTLFLMPMRSKTMVTDKSDSCYLMPLKHLVKRNRLANIVRVFNQIN